MLHAAEGLSGMGVKIHGACALNAELKLLGLL